MTTLLQTNTAQAERHPNAPDAGSERMISPRFAQVLRENPPAPHDWIAAAEQLSDEYERRFCLHRAGELG